MNTLLINAKYMIMEVFYQPFEKGLTKILLILI